MEVRTRPGPGRPSGPEATSPFEAAALPHLDAAYGLARRILGDEHDAQDAVQDAYARAFRHFGGFRGQDARAWLMAIVRNAALTLRRRQGGARAAEPLDAAESVPSPADDPEVALVRAAARARVREAVEALAPEFREVIVLRELHDLSYREIAEALGVPQGTVMSRLARARQQLARALAGADAGEDAP